MVSLSDLTQPLNIDDYALVTSMPPGCLFYGMLCRTKLDQEKVSINKKFKPVRLYNVLRTTNAFCVAYFYGSFFKVKNQYSELLENIENYSQLPHNKHNLFSYKKILSMYNLHCDDNFSLFNRGLYPLSPGLRENIFNDKINFDDYFKGNKEFPFYLTIAAPHIIYFSNNNKNVIEFKKYLQKNTPQTFNLDTINTQYEG